MTLLIIFCTLNGQVLDPNFKTENAATWVSRLNLLKLHQNRAKILVDHQIL